LQQIWSVYLFGCSGSGKTAQANRLVSFLDKRLGSCVLMDVGQIIRDEIKTNSHLLTDQDRKLMNSGRYISDTTIRAMVTPQLQAVPAKLHARVIVGWPRTPTQGQHMVQIVRSSKVPECSIGFLIDVPINICLERMGTQDDRDETTKASAARLNRVTEWRNFTVPTIENLKNEMKILTVMGTSSKDEVEMDIRTKLAPFLPGFHAPAHDLPLNPIDISQSPL